MTAPIFLLTVILPMLRGAPVGPPRCGVITSGAQQSVDYKWEKKDLTFSFEGSIRQDGMSESDTRNAVHAAFAAYAAVTPLTFKEVSSAFSDMQLEFARARHPGCYDRFDGPGGVLAHAYYPTDGRIHFDSDEKWTVMNATNLPNNHIDFMWTAMHEMGHALGLNHVDDPDSLMYAYYKDPTIDGHYVAPKLDDGVIRTLQHKYGRGNKSDSWSSLKDVSVEVVIRNSWLEENMSFNHCELLIENNSNVKICGITVRITPTNSRGRVVNSWNLYVNGTMYSTLDWLSIKPGASSSGQCGFISAGPVRLELEVVRSC